MLPISRSLDFLIAYSLTIVIGSHRAAMGGGGEIARGGCLILIFYGLGEAAASHVITRDSLLYLLPTQETASDFSPEQRR